MGFAKDLWIAAFDELEDEALANGKSPEEARAYAEDHATTRGRDKLADMADHLRQREKDAHHG